jgi:hypothetical protein
MMIGEAITAAAAEINNSSRPHASACQAEEQHFPASSSSCMQHAGTKTRPNDRSY